MLMKWMMDSLWGKDLEMWSVSWCEGSQLTVVMAMNKRQSAILWNALTDLFRLMRYLLLL